MLPGYAGKVNKLLSLVDGCCGDAPLPIGTGPRRPVLPFIFQGDII
jgi:hypothetical protein